MNRSHVLLVIVFVGLSTFCYEIGEVLVKIPSWEVAWNPPTVGQMLIAMSSALGSVAAALGVDLKALVGGGVTATPPVEKV